MSVECLGIVDAAQARRAAILANNPNLPAVAVARIKGLRQPEIIPEKTHFIQVNCATGERTILESRPVKAPVRVARPVIVTVRAAPEPKQSRSTARRPYSVMGIADRDAARETADVLLKITKMVTGYSKHVLMATASTRVANVSRARWLFFAMLQVSYPKITLHEMARPLGCDHTIPRHGLQRFAEVIDTSPMREWVNHPSLARMLPKLQALAARIQGLE